MTSELLMSDTSGYWNVTGDAVRADGFYGNADGLHTLQIYVSNLIGHVYIEGSIAEVPTDDDWFPIALNGHPYLTFPASDAGMIGETSINGYNFTYNLTWVRARLDRSYLDYQPPTPEGYIQYGTVSKILISI